MAMPPRKRETGFKHVCPTCGHKFEAQLAVGRAATERAVPTPGCLLICINCGEIMQMDATKTAQRLSEEEVRALPAETVQLLAQCEDLRQQAMRQHQRNPFPDLMH